MNFEDWPVWARPKEEKGKVVAPLEEAAAVVDEAERLNAFYEEQLKEAKALAPARKKPGRPPKPKGV